MDVWGPGEDSPGPFFAMTIPPGIPANALALPQGFLYYTKT